MRPTDREHSDSYAVQLARFKARERALDAGCAVVGAAWLLFTRLGAWFGAQWWVAAVAGFGALLIGYWALRKGNGRVANKINDELFEVKDE
jgi:hypothetical protein